MTPHIDPHGNSAAGMSKTVYVLIMLGCVMPVLALLGLTIGLIYRQHAQGWLRSHLHAQVFTTTLAAVAFLLSRYLLAPPWLYIVWSVVAAWVLLRCSMGFKQLINQQAYTYATSLWRMY